MSENNYAQIAWVMQSLAKDRRPRARRRNRISSLAVSKVGGRLRSSFAAVMRYGFVAKGQQES